jgi:hypothetical protein
MMASRPSLDVVSPPMRVRRYFLGDGTGRRRDRRGIQMQALPVAQPKMGRVITKEHPPENGEEYLLMVQQEAEREPDMVVVYFNGEEEPKDLLTGQLAAPFDEELESIEEDEEEFDEDNEESEEWDDEVTDYSDREQNDGDDHDGWKKGTLHKFREGQQANDSDSDSDSDESSSSAEDSDDEQVLPDVQTISEDFRIARQQLIRWKEAPSFKRVATPHRNDRQRWERLAWESPSTSLLLSLDHLTIERVLEYHVTWYEDELVVSRARAVWFYGLLGVLPPAIVKEESVKALLNRIREHNTKIAGQNVRNPHWRVMAIIILPFI